MTFPARQAQEENPSRTGWEGTARTPAAAPAEPEAEMDADAGVDTAAQANREATSDADAGPSVDTLARQRWSQIQAMFVDDPRGSVTQAAVMADEAIEAFIAAARERQAWLASSWQGQDAGTEELRTALQGYRAFWTSVTATPQPA